MTMSAPMIKALIRLEADDRVTEIKTRTMEALERRGLVADREITEAGSEALAKARELTLDQEHALGMMRRSDDGLAPGPAGYSPGFYARLVVLEYAQLALGSARPRRYMITEAGIKALRRAKSKRNDNLKREIETGRLESMLQEFREEQESARIRANEGSPWALPIDGGGSYG